jgi:UDP-glucose 4-epimerase
MNILITGVAGLLGSRLADWICENTEHIVFGIDDLSGGYEENVNAHVKFQNINCNSSQIENIFKHCNIDYVFHFASYAAEGLSPFIRNFNYQNNLLATTNIVNNCIKYDIKRLIFTSSLAVYGHGNNEVFEESLQPSPIDPYGVAKYACEMDIQIAGQQHGLDWCILRPHNIYGRNQNIWDKYRNVLGIWMYQHLNNQPMVIFGDGTQTRAFSYIDDILEPIWNSAISSTTSKQIINIGGTIEYSINEAAKWTKYIIGAQDIVYKEGRHEVKNAIPSFKKSQDLLGFEHKTILSEGIENMWKWAKRQPKREQFIWPEYELDKGLYSYWK